MKTDFDAIAVGGALSGSAFALTLARQGLKVAVIERTPRAQLKVCGDFLSAEAQQLLFDLGFDVWALGAHRIRDFRLAHGARAALAPLPFDAAGLSRLKLDDALLAEAGGRGAEIFRGQGASAIISRGGVVTVKFGDQSVTAKSVALATGKHNVRGFQRPSGDMTGFKMTFLPSSDAVRALSGVVQLVSYRGGYIGACLVEDGASTLCWLADKRLMHDTQGRWMDQLKAFAKRSDYLGNLLSGAKPVAARAATVSAIPFGFLRTEEVGAEIYPVGDQLAVIPSFTGDGTSIALSSGLAAAHAVLDGVPSGDYQRAFVRGLRGQFRWARAVDLSFKSGVSRYLSVAAISAFPGLATGLTSRTRLSNLPSGSTRTS